MAKKITAVGGYTRRTKTGKTVRVNPYSQKRDSALAALLKADPSRPNNNAQSGQFAGGSPVPVSKSMQAAQKRVNEATAKAKASQAARANAPETPKADTKKKAPATPKADTKKKAPAKKSQGPTAAKKEAVAQPTAAKKEAVAQPTAAKKAPAAKKTPTKAQDAPASPASTPRSSAPETLPEPAAPRPAARAPERGGPPLLRGIPRGQYTRDTMTPAEQKKRAAEVMDRIDRTLAVGDTQKRHSVAMKSKMAGGVDVVYSPERAAIHKEIISEMVEDARQRGVPRDGKAIVSGGLPGAGKSYVLGNRLGIDMDKYVVLNPDEFKERLIEKTQVPGTEDGKFGPMEMAAIVHEESSDLTKMARDVFESSGYNVILDVTLGGAGEKAKGKHLATIEGLRARGYTVDGVFVDIPHEMSKESAKGRYLGGWARWMNGEDPMGGRFVPESVAAADVSTQGYNSSNRDNFEHVKELFNDYKTIDNSVREDGAPLRVLDEGGNKHAVTPADPFVSNAFDPFDDPIARLEALLAKMRANRAKVSKS